MLKKIAILAAVLAVAFLVMMAAARTARFSVTNSLSIPQYPGQIWSVLSDVARWPLWWPGVQRAELPRGWQKGAFFPLELQGNPEKEPARVEACEDQRELAWWRRGVLGSQTRTRITLTGTTGGTLVSLESSIAGPQALLARITGRKAFEDYHLRVLGGLKEYMELREKQDAMTGGESY